MQYGNSEYALNRIQQRLKLAEQDLKSKQDDYFGKFDLFKNYTASVWSMPECVLQASREYSSQCAYVRYLQDAVSNPAKAIAIIAAEERAEQIKREKELELRKKAQRELDVKEEAKRTVAMCDATADESKEKSAQVFLQQLGHLLNHRKDVIPFFKSSLEENIKVIEQRTKFIQQLIPLIKNNDVNGQIEFLQEDKILPFKGKLTQKLYTVLVTRRAQLIKQQQFEKSIEPFVAQADGKAIELFSCKR